MGYENRLPPEGINVSEEHPLKEFFILVAGVGAAVLAVVVLLAIFAGWLVRYIPFETERNLAEKLFLSSNLKSLQLDGVQQDRRIYLQDLADKLASAQGLPDNFKITVHYVDNETVNAFATLGGNIIMFKGLLEKLPHENALAMVLAHEIAHVKHRDPMVASGRGLTVGLAIASLVGLGNSSVVDTLISPVASITILKYSRNQEQAADMEAMETLHRHYGHLSGAEVLFEVLMANQEGHVPPIFLSSHPVSERRIETIRAYRVDRSWEGELTKLPDILNPNKH
jgi:predicted Zn-dependent protease